MKAVFGIFCSNLCHFFSKMYFNNDPPSEEHGKEFPTMSSVVSVSNCWYYLSLLERFVDITSSMTEDILKMYLVRAEYRYFLWISNKHYYRNLDRAVPPIGKSSTSCINISSITYFYRCGILLASPYAKPISFL